MFHYAQTADDLASLHRQELFTVCENSSAYESSEDTGVGGLSESELMGASDGIGKFEEPNARNHTLFGAQFSYC